MRHCLRVQLATVYGQEGLVKPFRIHVADEVLNDLRARLRQTRQIGSYFGPEVGFEEISIVLPEERFWPTSLEPKTLE